MAKNEIKRRIDWAGYINVAPKGSGEEATEFAVMGTGFTEQGDSPSAQTSGKRYVNMKCETKNITGYDWSSAFTADDIPDEKAIAFLYNIGDKELTGADASTDYVKVDFLKPVGDSTTEFEAKMRTVACEISEFSDNDGEMQVSGNLLAKDDWVFGKFDTSTKKFSKIVEEP